MKYNGVRTKVKVFKALDRDEAHRKLEKYGEERNLIRIETSREGEMFTVRGWFEVEDSKLLVEG